MTMMMIKNDDDDDDLPKKVVLMTISTPPSEQQGQKVLTTLSVNPISRFWTFFSRKSICLKILDFFLFRNQFDTTLSVNPISKFCTSFFRKSICHICCAQFSLANPLLFVYKIHVSQSFGRTHLMTFLFKFVQEINWYHKPIFSQFVS